MKSFAFTLKNVYLKMNENETKLISLEALAVKVISIQATAEMSIKLQCKILSLLRDSDYKEELEAANNEISTLSMEIAKELPNS